MTSAPNTLELLNPQIDVVFKMLLLRHTPLLGSMLEAVLAQPLASFSVLNPELTGELPESKAVVVDLLVELLDGRRVNVEMQVRARPELRPRLVYYAARNLSEQLSRGDGYLQIRPSSVVVWLAEPLFADLDQFHSIFELRERATHLRYGEESTIHLLQLSKLQAATAEPPASYARLAALWGRFLSAKTRLDFVELRAQNPIMSQAVDALEELSTNPEARRIATKRLIDQKFHEMGIAMAREEATKLGIAEGVAIGEATMLLRILESKFGTLSSEIAERVRTATSSELERWGRRISETSSLDELFGE